jgi:transposase
MTIVEADRAVTGGVDTHLDVHVAAALDGLGGVLGVASFGTSTAGYRQLFEWMSSFGTVARVGVEGTGAYGAGLTRYLHRHGVQVVEVDRANRQARRQGGKSDPADAVEAARAAQSGRARGLAKTRDGNVEAIRALLVTRRSSRTMRVKTLCQMRHLTFTGPDELRERLQDLSPIMLPREAAAMRPRAGNDIVAYTTKLAVKTLARRVVALDAETEQIDELLETLVAETAPTPARLAWRRR